MSLLEKLKAGRSHLQQTVTTVTTATGQKYEETKAEDGSIVSSRPSASESPGYVVDTKPDLQVGEIGKGLFLGSQDPAYDALWLEEHRITHVLSLGIKPSNLPKNIENCFVYALDTPETRLVDCAEEECFPFIDRALKKNGNVLVHCNAGVSRSATVVIAYLMKTKKMSYAEAYLHVKERRRVICPNSGFVEQLKHYETTLARREAEKPKLSILCSPCI